MEHAISLPAEPVIQIKGFEISNALLTSWVVVLFLVILSIVLRAKLKTIPGRLQGFFEVLFEGGLDLCDQVTGDRKLSQKVFPIVFTFFIFILL